MFNFLSKIKKPIFFNVSFFLIACLLIGWSYYFAPTLTAASNHDDADKSWYLAINDTLPATYYMDATGGNDSNSGLSETLAWKTINRINNKMNSSQPFQPGDTISFKKGEVWYKNGDILSNRYYLTINKSGTIDYPITFNSYGSGPLPIIGGIYIIKANYINIDGIQSDTVVTGTEIGTGYTLVNQPLLLVGSHDINITKSVFDGKSIMNKKGSAVINIRKEPYSGITMAPTYNITFRNCEILNAGSNARNPNWSAGLHFDEGVHDILIEGCKIHDNKGNNVEASGTENSYKYDWGYNIILRNNEIYNSPDKRGAPYYKDGINIGWNFKDCIVEKNYIHDVNLLVQTDARTSNNIIRNNILVNGTGAFIRILASSLFSPSSPEYPFNGKNEKTFILNNTFISNIANTNGRTSGIWLSTDGIVGGAGHVIKNNLFYSSIAEFEYILNYSDSESKFEFISNNNSFYTTTGSGRFRYNNVLYNNIDKWKASGRDTESMFGDPLLSLPNYLPSVGSPVIDRGVDLSNTSDYAGNPIYGKPDIGAYEYQPPYTMGIAKVDIGAGARVYGDGKFRDLNVKTGEMADIVITPFSGSFNTYSASEARPQWLDITGITWKNTGNYYKAWTESSVNMGLNNTSHIIGNLIAGKYYIVKVDGILGKNIVGSNIVDGVLKSNDAGKIKFNYSGDYLSPHKFEVEYWK